MRQATQRPVPRLRVSRRDEADSGESSERRRRCSPIKGLLRPRSYLMLKFRNRRAHLPHAFGANVVCQGRSRIRECFVPLFSRQSDDAFDRASNCGRGSLNRSASRPQLRSVAALDDLRQLLKSFSLRGERPLYSTLPARVVIQILEEFGWCLASLHELNKRFAPLRIHVF